MNVLATSFPVTFDILTSFRKIWFSAFVVFLSPRGGSSFLGAECLIRVEFSTNPLRPRVKKPQRSLLETDPREILAQKVAMHWGLFSPVGKGPKGCVLWGSLGLWWTTLPVTLACTEGAATVRFEPKHNKHYMLTCYFLCFLNDSCNSDAILSIDFASYAFVFLLLKCFCFKLQR